MSQEKRVTGIQAVLFDLDGTLVQTHIDFPQMKSSILALVAGEGLLPDEFRHLDILTIISTAKSRVSDPSSFAERAEAALTAIELAACEGAELASGALETLNWLQAHGVRLGIVTRNCIEAAERVLTRFPLPHDVLLTRAHTPRVKPDPYHLQLALEHLQVPPERALMVGDHLMDIQAGKAAGTHTVGILTDERSDDYFLPARPDQVIRTLPELKTWISPLLS